MFYRRLDPVTDEELLTGARGREVCVRALSRVDRAVEAAWSFAQAREESPEAAEALAAALRDADVAAVSTIGAGDLLEALADSVASAMYWQPPFGHEQMLAAEPVRSTLPPIAAALVAGAPAAWWESGLSTGQHHVRFIYQGRRPADPEVDPGAGLQSWREAARTTEEGWVSDSDPDLEASGAWWSTPIGHVLDTARLGPGHRVALILVEECTGDFEEALVWPVAVDAGARVYEIAGPADWVALVGEYPFDVSRSRRGDWYRTTGRDGPWRIADWHAVAERWDGVHLTTAGYLATAGRALDLDDGSATVLAGFNPDQTFWLRDVARISGPAQHWTCDSDDATAWVRTP